MEEYQQMSIFDVMYENYKITKPIRLIELFAGIGSQAKALKNIGANFETYKVVEFDKYANASYNAIHNTNFKTLDITQIGGDDLEIKDTDKYEYIMTYSFPCQDLSLAGKQKGMSKGTSTRSGLLWEVERLLNECKEKPQILLMENVPQVHSKDNINDFNMWINFLESLGYKNYWKDLNAKNYGIPQNRNRTFMISILGDYNYNFPKKQKLKLRVKDMLEDEVDDSYYLSDKMINYICSRTPSGNHHITTGINMGNKNTFKIAGTITTGEGSKPSSNYIIENETFDYSKDKGKIINIKEELNLFNLGAKQFNRRTGSVVNINGISSTLLARTQGDNNLILIPEATKQGYAVTGDGDGVYINRPYQKRGVVQKGLIQTLKTQPDDVGVVVEYTRNMKEKLCNELIEKNVVKENYVINHSYTNGLNGKNPNSRISLEDYIETTDNCSPCLTTRPDTLGVCVKDETPKVIAGLGEMKSNNGTQFYQQDRVYDGEGIAMCHPANLPNGSYYYGFDELSNLRIRKLTPKECFRLMGFDDEDFDKASKVNSNAQLYKQAGNSIVVNVLMEILKQLF